MTEKNRWQAVFASLTLTLALLGCEDSITGIPEPVAEATYAVEAVESVALMTGGCFPPGDDLVSWWPGEDDFDDVAPLADGTPDPSPNHITKGSDAAGIRTDISNGTVGFEAGTVGRQKSRSTTKLC